MDKKQAYEFFLKSLTAQLLRVTQELDNSPANSPRYSVLTDEMVRIQTALANLDDIAKLC